MSEVIDYSDDFFNLKDENNVLKEANHKLKDEIAELRVKHDTLMRLINKSREFVIGYDERNYEVTVQWRSEGKWAVCVTGLCLNGKGEWEFERLASSRGEDFIERTRFDFDIAMRLASEVVVSEKRVLRKPKMTEEVIEV